MCGAGGGLGEGIIEEMSLHSGVSRKQVSDGADVTFSGRVFHSQEAATGKARSPMVERRYLSQQALMMRQNGDADGPRHRKSSEIR